MSVQRSISSCVQRSISSWDKPFPVLNLKLAALLSAWATLELGPQPGASTAFTFFKSVSLGSSEDGVLCPTGADISAGVIQKHVVPSLCCVT